MRIAVIGAGGWLGGTIAREALSRGIEVTAIHTHMLNEEPRVFFIHFWANDDALKLARNIRIALDKTAVAH